MARVSTMSIQDFMSGKPWDCDKPFDALIEHLKRYKIAYRIIGMTLIIFLSGGFDFTALASSGSIDTKGYVLYRKLLSIGKWVIIIKGGWDTINNTIKGDFDAAKRSFFSYLLIYIVLLGLPWALNQVDDLFSDGLEARR